MVEAAVAYKLRPGFRLKGPIGPAAARIEELKRRHATRENPDGMTTDEEIVEDAKDANSPLHSYFDWDVEKAAQRWWVEHAGYLRRSYITVVSRSNEEPINVCPANVRVIMEGKESVFVSPTFAMSVPDYRVQVLKETIGQLRGMQVRLQNLEGLSPNIIKTVAFLKDLIEVEAAKVAKKGEKAEAEAKDGKAKGGKAKKPMQAAQRG